LPQVEVKTTPIARAIRLRSGQSVVSGVLQGGIRGGGAALAEVAASQAGRTALQHAALDTFSAQAAEDRLVVIFKPIRVRPG
jgi:hypothetical protein